MNAYTEGRDAYYHGFQRDQNPYSEMGHASDWQEGWDDAYDDDTPYEDGYDE